MSHLWTKLWRTPEKEVALDQSLGYSHTRADLSDFSLDTDAEGRPLAKRLKRSTLEAMDSINAIDGLLSSGASQSIGAANASEPEERSTSCCGSKYDNKPAKRDCRGIGQSSDRIAPATPFYMDTSPIAQFPSLKKEVKSAQEMDIPLTVHTTEEGNLLCFSSILSRESNHELKMENGLGRTVRCLIPKKESKLAAHKRAKLAKMKAMLSSASKQPLEEDPKLENLLIQDIPHDFLMFAAFFRKKCRAFNATHHFHSNLVTAAKHMNMSLEISYDDRKGSTSIYLDGILVGYGESESKKKTKLLAYRDTGYLLRRQFYQMYYDKDFSKKVLLSSNVQQAYNKSVVDMVQFETELAEFN